MMSLLGFKKREDIFKSLGSLAARQKAERAATREYEVMGMSGRGGYSASA